MRELRPFAAEERTRGFALRAEIEGAHVVWELCGPLGLVRIPARAARASRRTGLWNATCFEAFFAGSAEEGAPYVELNVSPSGDWNAFALASYRTGLAELEVHAAPRIEIARSAEFLRVECEFRIPEARLASLTAVLEHTDGEFSYWALAHTGAEPDFHRKDSFVLAL